MMKKRHTAGIAVLMTILLAASAFAGCIPTEPPAKADEQTEVIAASADGVQITMKEYRATFEMFASYYGNSKLSEETLRALQESIARQVLLQKIYIKEAQARGIVLTAEEKATCLKSAQEYVDGVEEQYHAQLTESGNYTDQAYILLVSTYYQNLGMQKEELRDLIVMGEESELYRTKLEQYYAENVTPDEETLQRYYRESVEQSMYTESDDGTKTSVYTPGMFWYYLKGFQTGTYSPMLYVPEGFIFIDYIEIVTASTEEAEEIVLKVKEGKVDFDELMNSEENADPFRGTLKTPYAIGETDHSELFTPQMVYTKATALQVGEIDSFVGQAVTDDDGNTTVTAYLFRRANGDMCVNGESGIIDIDWYSGVREKAIATYRGMLWSKWLDDVRYEDVLYEYKGRLG